MTRPLRIAMIGSRGVPATFGGIEHHVEELGSRLVELGHDVTVFARRNYVEDPPASYRGMAIRTLPTVSSKHLDAIVHSTLSTLSAMRGRVDVVHFHAVGPGIPAVLPRYLSPTRVVLTVHGLDGDRAKWGSAARRVLKGAEWMSSWVPDATIVVSRALERHYRGRYGRSTHHIPNGVVAPTRRPAQGIVERFGLEPGRYLLFVGRMVPEKAPDLLIRAFARVPGDDLRLVLAGGSSFTDDYVRSLRRAAEADARVVLTGYVYGELLEELYANAAAFVLPSALEGLPLTLLEAASYGTPVIASDIEPHLEVIGEDAPGRRLFPMGDEAALVESIRTVLTDPRAERAGADTFAADVLERYRWDDVARRTEAVYRDIVGV